MTIEQNRIADTINGWLDAEDRNVLWLSNKSGIPNSTLTRRLKHGAGFTVEDLGLIAPVIGMSAFELMAAGDPARQNAEAVSA